MRLQAGQDPPPTLGEPLGDSKTEGEGVLW